MPRQVSPRSSVIEAGSASWPGFRSSRGSGPSSTRLISCSRRCSRPSGAMANSAAAPRPSWRPGCGRSWRTSCSTRCATLPAPAARRRPRDLARPGARRILAQLGAALQAPGSSPSEAASRHELELQLANALSRLPADYAEIILLRNVEGLSHDEAAKRMGRGVGAVRMLWVRALALLRQELEPDGDSERLTRAHR